MLEVPDLLVREVDLDAARGLIHVDVQVVLAADVGARARHVGAVSPALGPPVVPLWIQEIADAELLLGEALHGDGPRAEGPLGSP